MSYADRWHRYTFPFKKKKKKKEKLVDSNEWKEKQDWNPVGQINSCSFIFRIQGKLRPDGWVTHQRWHTTGCSSPVFFLGLALHTSCRFPQTFHVPGFSNFPVFPMSFCLYNHITH